MFLKRLELIKFRNYNDLAIEFSPQVNIFFGQNAQGKTNLLEAIAMLSLGKSFRAKKDEEVIQWGSETSFLKGIFVGEQIPATIEIGIGRTDKRFQLNQQIVKRKDIFGQVPVVIFAPDDLQLIKGGPSFRRDFLDLYLAQIEPKYRFIYYNYSKVLQQRNRLLKEKEVDRTELDVWNEQLAEKGAKVIKHRLWFIESAIPYISKAQLQISNSRETLIIEYTGFKNQVFQDMTEEEIKRCLQEGIRMVRQTELERKITLIGPQFDDLRILLDTGVDLRVFGSQGQQRTAALALKLGLIEKMKDARGEYPVLLLDDVMSEFDDGRKRALLASLVNSVQTFITATNRNDFANFAQNAALFEIERGAIKIG
jgi:DNA replication and repair protein RecF